MPTNATGSGGIQLVGTAGATLYGPSLITVTRLLDNLNNRLLTSDEATTCANLIDCVSAAIRRYCRTVLAADLRRTLLGQRPATLTSAASPSPACRGWWIG